MFKLADTVPTAGGMDYHLRVIRDEDKEKVVKFLRRFFFRDEPLNQAIKLIPEGEDSTCIELEEYSLSSIDDHLSLMAVSSTGAIIGVLLNGKKIACRLNITQVSLPAPVCLLTQARKEKKRH